MSKRTVRVLLIGFLGFLLALCAGFTRNSANAHAATQSLGECVIEVSSRRVLFGRNERDCLPMASTTKIMTAILVLDDCDLNETVVIPKAAEGIEGSSVYLRAGEEYTVLDLLYGLMLRSGNDCAVALALHHSGSVEAFARRMTERAAFLGAEDSFFANPHGLPAKGHHTTARDLAILASYAMENETFAEIVSTKYYAARKWQNKNKMLWNYDGATGIKTGFTMQAGRCLVTGAERNGMKLVSVVLNSPQMYERTAELLDDCFTNYRMTTLCDSTKPIEGLRMNRSFSYPLTEEEAKNIEIRVEKLPEQSSQSGDFAGTMQIFLEKNLIFSQNLYIM